MPTSEELNSGFNLGEWEVLPNKGVMRRGDEEVRPEPKVLAVLLALARRDGDLVTQDMLIDEVWEGRAFGNEPIQRCIALLRRHFHDTKPFEYIETLQRRGYRLLKRVKLHEQPEAPVAAPREEPAASARLWKVVAAVVAAGFIAIAAYTWIPSGEPAVRSLAILPIDNLSGDPSNAWIPDGIKTILAQRLTELPEFTIKNVRVAYEGSPEEIAKKLGVESVLYGAVQLNNRVLRVNFEIVRGSDGVSMLVGEESGSIDKLFGLQERLAIAVRNALAGPKTPQLITRQTPNSAAYNSYMRGMSALELRFDGDNLERAIERFEESIRLDEGYGPAYLALATAYALLPDYRNAPVQEALDRAIETVEAGVEMDSTIEGPAGAIYGFKYHQEKKWLESEAAYQRAVNSPVVDSNAFSWYSRMLASVGRLEDALDMALKAEALDPDNAVVNSRIAMAYTWLGNTAQAHEYFERANELGATGIIHVMAHSMLLSRGGQANLSRNLTFAAMEMVQAPTYWIDPVYRSLEDPTYKEEALAAIDRAWSEQQVVSEIVLVVRSLLGDLDGAMEIARKLEEPGEVFAMEVLFIPEIAPLRQHPDFYPLLERLGIVEYWDDVGCSWDGDKVHCATR